MDEKRCLSLSLSKDKYSDYCIDDFKHDVLDSSVYSNASKDGENRPFNLIEGSFNDMVVSGFIDENAFIYIQSPTIEPETTVNIPIITPITELDLEIPKYNDYAGLIDKSILEEYETYFKFQRARILFRICFHVLHIHEYFIICCLFCLFVWNIYM